MEITIAKAEKDAKKQEDSPLTTSKSKELADTTASLSGKLVKKAKPENVLILNVKRSRNGKSCIQESFLRHIRGLESRVPRHIISFDEKYLRHCLELIYASAAKAASCKFPEGLGTLKIANLSDDSSLLKLRSGYACDLTKFVAECPLEAGTGNAVMSPTREWIVGAITGSKSVLNILKSPLFRQSGATDGEFSFGRANLIDTAKPVGCDFMSSPGWSSIGSSQKPGKKHMGLRHDRCGSDSIQKRRFSMSSTNSTFSDQSSSSGSTGITQGMVHCTWKAGFPHYVFSLDDQKEAYVANLVKPESPNDKAFDYMYMFHSNDADLVGKMRVSTTFTLCPDNSEIKETEFVLFGNPDESSVGEVPTSRHVHKKSKGLPKKIVEVFKTGHPTRERTYSTDHGPFSSADLSEDHLPPNLELAAIVIKEHTCGEHEVAKIGGWGLKFLKKVETRLTARSVEVSASECCPRNTTDCSTSMDILIPAGFHGGPRNRNDGPSGLIDRWKSGGRCNCGGWDIGCPLTVLNTKQSREEASPQADTQEDCRSFDLFIQGSVRGGQPIMKMVNIHDGLYFIHFQPALSALQSLSIAVAIIHSQSPTLQPKMYRS